MLTGKHPAFVFFLFILLCSANTSLFAQENEEADTSISPSANFRYNAGEEQVAGPILPDGLKDFTASSVSLINQFGSFSFRNNGLKATVSSGKYDFFASYIYQNYNGYQAHSTQYWNVANIGLRITPSLNSSLTILASYVTGFVRLPGSLTKEEYEQDPFRADQRAIDRDEKNIPVNSGLDIKYETRFGKTLNNRVEVAAHSAINNFESATREYRIVGRYGVWLNARYSNLSKIWNRTNVVYCGTDLAVQPERTEYYDNLAGQKGDLVEQITSQKSSKAGIFVADTFEILKKSLFINFGGRYDYEVYTLAEQTLPSRSDKRIFSYLTPRIGLDYTVVSWLDLFASFNLGYRSPADIQLSSPDPFYLYNPTLKPQTSENYEAGLKIRLLREESTEFLPAFHFKASFVYSNISNEIVPYEVFGDVFFRNASTSKRYGIGLDSRLEIIENLSFDISYIWSRFIYGTYQAISIETDSTGNVVQVERDFSGNIEPGIPANYLGMSLAYTYPLAKKVSLMAKLGYTGVSGLWVNDLNVDKTSPFNLLDAMVRCDATLGHFNLMAAAGVNNIFNARYVGYTNVNSANQRFYVAGAPLNLACSLNLGYTF